MAERNWWQGRMVVLRAEAPDRDWTLLRMVSPDREEDALAALSTVIAELRLPHGRGRRVFMCR